MPRLLAFPGRLGIHRGIAVKKGVVAFLIIIALIVLVSPGIVGHLAERSVDNQIEFAASESDDVVIRSARFDRGWFSSEGQHRIEFQDTPNTAGAMSRRI